jgi:hypothetical protein
MEGKVLPNGICMQAAGIVTDGACFSRRRGCRWAGKGWEQGLGADC